MEIKQFSKTVIVWFLHPLRVMCLVALITKSLPKNLLGKSAGVLGYIQEIS
jgi:hypothetical protein